MKKQKTHATSKGLDLNIHNSDASIMSIRSLEIAVNNHHIKRGIASISRGQ